MKEYIKKRLFDKVYNSYNGLSYGIDKTKTLEKIEKLFNAGFLKRGGKNSSKDLVTHNIILTYLQDLNRELNHKIAFGTNREDDFYIHRIDRYTLNNREIMNLNKKFGIN